MVYTEDLGQPAAVPLSTDTALPSLTVQVSRTLPSHGWTWWKPVQLEHKVWAPYWLAGPD